MFVVVCYRLISLVTFSVIYTQVFCGGLYDTKAFHKQMMPYCLVDHLEKRQPNVNGYKTFLSEMHFENAMYKIVAMFNIFSTDKQALPRFFWLGYAHTMHTFPIRCVHLWRRTWGVSQSKCQQRHSRCYRDISDRQRVNIPSGWCGTFAQNTIGASIYIFQAIYEKGRSHSELKTRVIMLFDVCF